MSSQSPPTKKLKKDIGDSEESKDYDLETQKALEEIDSCQNQIDCLNEKASEDILKVEQKYNKLRKPHFEKRNQIIQRIPNFWVTSFVNHPQISSILDEDEEDCLHFLSKLEVEEFEDIKLGYKINFYFEPNPYLENDVITKEFHLGTNEPCTKSTQIRWKEGQNLIKLVKEKHSQRQGRKRNFETRSFFIWFEDSSDPSADEVAEVIKDDLWPNPLQYYLSPDDGVNGMEGEGNDEEDGSDEDADDSVVVLEEIEEEIINDDEDDILIEDDGNFIEGKDQDDEENSASENRESRKGDDGKSTVTERDEPNTEITDTTDSHQNQ